MTHIALLRGVNVGGNQMVAMADLRDLLAKLKFGGVRSLLQSGNLVFQCDGRTCDEIEQLLETETKKRLKLATEFFVRSAAEFKEVIAKNPFPTEAERDPGHLVAIFMKHEPGIKQVADLEAAIIGPEKISVMGKLAYIVYPNGIGRSKVTNALIDRKLNTCGTGRNWNTVLKLYKCAQPM